MFFILLYLSQLFKKDVSSVSASLEDIHAKENSIKAIKEGKWESNTWIDRKCVERDLITNEPRFTRRINGDKVVTDIYGNVVRNISNEKRVNELNTYLKHNDNPFRTVIKWGDDPHLNEPCEGVRYKEITTGRIFVCRSIRYNYNDYTFFMDASTGEYVRPTDGMYQMWDYNGTTEKELENAREALKIGLRTKIGKYDNCCKGALHVEVSDYYDKEKDTLQFEQDINF